MNGVDLSTGGRDRWPGGEKRSGKTTLGGYGPAVRTDGGRSALRGQVAAKRAVTVSTDREGNPTEPTQVPYYRLTQVIFQNPYSSLNPRKTVAIFSPRVVIEG